MRFSWIVCFLVFCCSADAIACKCMNATLEEQTKNADEIYIATLKGASVVAGNGTQIEQVKGNFSIARTLKGPVRTKDLVLSTAAHDSACGIDLVVSGTYVILKRRGLDVIGACDGSFVLDKFTPMSRYDEADVKAAVQAASQKSAKAAAGGK